MIYIRITIADKLNQGAFPALFARARELRKDPTEAETWLWNELRSRRFMGIKFRRQHPIDGFILDFYCHDLKLSIEIDGGIHLLPGIRKYDQYRTSILREIGINELRFTNQEVIKHMDTVLVRIQYTVNMTLKDIGNGDT